MSRSAKVYIKGIYAGLLTEIDREHYSFRYDTDYYNNQQLLYTVHIGSICPIRTVYMICK